MDFDIHQLDGVAPDSDGAEAALEEYQNALLQRFSESPEGQERLQAARKMGFWAAQLMYYGYQYEGSVISQMSVGEVRTVVADLFPRKISLRSPEEADDAIPELTAFWKYLQREFHLPHADAILDFLREVQPDFPAMMNDPANFGMAKSFFTIGQAAGFDMTTQAGLNAFMLAYNSSLLARRTQTPARTEARPQPEPLMPKFSFFDPPSGLDPANFDAPRGLDSAKEKAEKKKRKQAEAARKRNRKRRK